MDVFSGAQNTPTNLLSFGFAEMLYLKVLNGIIKQNGTQTFSKS